MRLNVACLVFAISVVLGVALSSDAAVTVTGPDAPRQWEATAVSELKSYLATAVPSGTVTVGGASNVVFHVGDTVFAARKGLSSRALKDEEWVIRSFGGDVVVNGGGTRGCLYAVSHFLEDEVGVRWWSDKEEDVPVRERLDLKALRRRGKPHFLYRNVYRDAAERDPRTMVRRRLNANGADGGVIPFAWGGSIEYGSPKHCHNWEHFIPWAKYGKDHPEWFSLWKGRRFNGSAGGTGFDIRDLKDFDKLAADEHGRKWIRYVRISNMIDPNGRGDETTTPEVDAVADVAPVSDYELWVLENYGFANAWDKNVTGRDVVSTNYDYVVNEEGVKGAVKGAISSNGRSNGVCQLLGIALDDSAATALDFRIDTFEARVDGHVLTLLSNRPLTADCGIAVKGASKLTAKTWTTLETTFKSCALDADAGCYRAVFSVPSGDARFFRMTAE